MSTNHRDYQHVNPVQVPAGIRRAMGDQERDASPPQFLAPQLMPNVEYGLQPAAFYRESVTSVQGFKPPPDLDPRSREIQAIEHQIRMFSDTLREELSKEQLQHTAARAANVYLHRRERFLAYILHLEEEVYR